MAPPSSPSSLVQTRREWGVTSMYLPKTSITFEPPTPNTRRYLPPARTSISQVSRDMPIDLGTHHRLNSSGLVQASNTMRAGAAKVRVTTSSRSDFRSVVVRLFIGSFLCVQFLNDLVQRIEARGPELAVSLDPGRLFLKPAQTQLAGANPPDLFRGHQPGLLQHADMLLHAGKGHVELFGKLRDRGV